MTKEEMEQLQKMMILTFNDGFDKVVVPRLDEMEEGFEERLEKTVKKLREEFKKGQVSLSNGFEDLSNGFEEMKQDMKSMDRKMDEIVKKDVEQDKRLDKIEVIIKAN